MALGRSATLGAEERGGESVWLLLCGWALRGIRWSARALAADGSHVGLDRAELLARLGGDSNVNHDTPASIDWEKLDAQDRGLVARQLGRAPNRY